MKFAALCTILLLSLSCSYGQNLIGYNDDAIRKYMKENMKEMNIETVRNKMFTYLKYSDNFDSQTILFFMTPDSVCKSVRVICDNTLKSEKIKELDKAYTRVAADRWIDKHDGKNYLISFKHEQWSCTITIEPDK
jgi:hypothetical protein